MDTAVSDFGPLLHAQQLRQSWQARVLLAAHGKLRAVVESVLAHNFDEAFPILLRALNKWVHPPGLCSAGKIARSGHVCADIIRGNGERLNMQAFFRDTQEMQNEFRRLADATKLTDAERVEMFTAVQRWIVCDYRLDPNMDPRDPDAKRLVM